MNSANRSDIASRASIVALVDAFYEKIQRDDLLGFIFSEIAAVDWSHHLPKMYDFWESVVFRKGSYQGNPLAIHAALTSRTPMGREQFERWVTLFHATVDEHFTGPQADFIKKAASDIAAVLHRRINHLPDSPEWVRPIEPVR